MKKISTIILGLILFTSLNAQTTITLDSTTLTEREVAIGIQIPWEILWGPDDFIWVTERRGRVLHINPENGNTNTILNIQSMVDGSFGEPGLLGMALHPDFENTPKVYLVYNYIQGGFNIRERLVSYDWDGQMLSNENTLIDNIPGGGIHNGARLLISTDDKILMTTGDTGSGNLSQNLNSLNGKVLRINLDGSIPSDNPDPSSYIYSFGHRNAQGLAYGPNGQLYSSEHGAQRADEFNLIEENRNYGWPNVEGECNTTAEMGFCDANNVREPLAEWTPCVAVNGLEYYTHPSIPEWQNTMLMAVLGGFALLPRLSVLHFNADGTAVEEEVQYFNNYGRIRDVCVNPHNGAVFFATNGPSYPGSGPNRIIEYRNLDWMTTDVDSEVLLDQYVVASPNPVSKDGILSLEFSENFMGYTYELISFSGQLVKQAKIDATRMEINAGQFAAGTYYVKASNEEGTITKKIIIQ